jgi:hypothetical protein
LEWVLTNNLTDVGHQQLATLREHNTFVSFLLRYFLHIKCFELGREAMQKYRFANYIRHLPFSSLGNVVAHLVLHHDDLPTLVFDDVAFSVLGGVFYTMLVDTFDRVNI